MITTKHGSITLIVAALWSAPASAGDLPPTVYVAPGGVYIGSARVYVAPNAGNGEQSYVTPGYVTPGYAPHAHTPTYAPAYAPNYAPEYQAPGYAPAYVPAYRAAPAYTTRPRVYASPYQTEYAPRPPAVVPYNNGRNCLMYQGRIYCE